MQSSLKPETTLFDKISNLKAGPFSTLVNHDNVNSQKDDIPLLHYIVRNAGPRHLDTLLEHKVEINALTKATDTLAESSALQWITGMIYPRDYLSGWPRNYEQYSGGLTYNTLHKTIRVDMYTGSANEIMEKVAATLLENGAHLDFYSAAALGKTDFVTDYLAKNKEVIDVPGPDGCTALAWAARRGQDEMIQLLLKHGAKVNQSNIHGPLYPLEEAARFHGKITTLGILIKHHAFIRPGLVSVCNHLEKVDFILGQLTNPTDLITINDMRHIAGSVHYDDYIKLFYKHRIQLTEVDKELRKQGHWPLIFDGWDHTPDTLRFLIAMGADPKAPFSKMGDIVSEASPIAFVLIHLSSKKDPDEILKLLQVIAILFIHSSPLESCRPKHPKQLDPLHADQLIHFLIFLDAELKLPDNKQKFAQLDDLAKSVLKEKINEALTYLSADLPASALDQLIKSKTQCLQIIKQLEHDFYFNPSINQKAETLNEFKTMTLR